MSQGISKLTLFNRYNIAVFVLFVIITLVATGVAVYRYHVELEQQLVKDSIALGEQAQIIHQSLEKSEQTLRGLKQFSQYYLKNPDDFFASSPSLVQDGDKFYLKTNKRDLTRQVKRLQGNITGRGSIAQFDESMWRELSMANALTPAFVTGSQSNPDATWFYYISLNRFINIYPWISRNAWQYSDRMLNESYLWQIRQDNLQGMPFVWSYPYQDSAGQGLKASIGTGVFFEGEFRGALVIDVDLASLQQKLPQIADENHGYALINEQGIVLVHATHEEQTLETNAKWQDFAPQGLNTLTNAQLLNFEGSYQYQQWLLQKHQLEINGWSLIKYQPYDDFSFAPKSRFVFYIATFFAGLVAFLAVVYVLTRKTFIKPASEFINHIEHCAEGNPGKVQPTKEWLPWFQLVENIFGQNRSLLHQLKEQNAELDSRVVEKTQALTERSEQSHRAYVLLRSVINAIPEFIIFNDNDGNLTGCNSAFELFIGENEQALLGVQIAKLLPKAIQDTLEKFENLPESKTTLGYHQSVETSGNTYEIFCTRFYNEAGQSLGTIVILRDVSVQSAVQETLKQAKDQAVLANKAKSQFLANMSHEIRTPINAVQGMMTLMEKTHLTAFQQQYLANAQSSSAALLHLVDELLDLSKIEAGKFRLNFARAKLDGIVDRVLQLNTLNLHNKGLKFVVDIDANAPELVRTDEMRLTQVLANLLNNAIKFTHQGTITLSIKVVGIDANNALLRFTVTDTGIGIAEDKISKLFVAFSQADESMTREYGGSGLGLAISQQIVQLLGGEIKINSTQGKGSEFSFLVPMRIEQQEIEKTANAINIVSLGCDISSTFIDAITNYGWQYYGVDNVEQFNRLTVTGQTVLLVDSNYLVAQKHVQLCDLESHLGNVILTGICQPIMMEISVKIIEQLKQLSSQYILFDVPLYRFTLSKIDQYIRLQAQQLETVEIPHGNSAMSSALESQVLDQRQSASQLSHSLTGISVLLVEDNLVNQMVAQELLLSMGANVSIAENGEVAINCIIQHCPDIVLMDIQMPVMDGLTASKKIRAMEEYKKLPIIAMTAHARAEDKTASKEAGMNLHISKPVSADVLAASILNLVKAEHQSE